MSIIRQERDKKGEKKTYILKFERLGVHAMHKALRFTRSQPSCPTHTTNRFHRLHLLRPLLLLVQTLPMALFLIHRQSIRGIDDRFKIDSGEGRVARRGFREFGKWE